MCSPSPAELVGHSQLVQLLAEAPAIAVDPGDGVVAKVQLVQGREAVQRAAIHLRQAVVLQVPATTVPRAVNEDPGVTHPPTHLMAKEPLPAITPGGTKDLMTLLEGLVTGCALTYVCTPVEWQGGKATQTAVRIQAD